MYLTLCVWFMQSCNDFSSGLKGLTMRHSVRMRLVTGSVHISPSADGQQPWSRSEPVLTVNVFCFHPCISMLLIEQVRVGVVEKKEMFALWAQITESWAHRLSVYCRSNKLVKTLPSVFQQSCKCPVFCREQWTSENDAGTGFIIHQLWIETLHSNWF